jgi:hypothetical protein
MTLEKSVAPMTDSSDDVSTKRFSAAAEKMQSAGFADAEQKQTPVDMAVESWIKLRENVQNISGILTSARRKRSKV